MALANKPVPGGDLDTWGQKNNDCLDELDADVTARVPKDVAQAKGDVIVGTGPATVGRLPVGTDGHVLHADAATTTGLRWAAVPQPGFGTTATRPAPSAGARYFATDTGIWWDGVSVSGTSYWVPPAGTVVAAYRQDATQSIPTATDTRIWFSVEIRRLYGEYGADATTGRYRPGVPGFYLLAGACGYPVSTGVRYTAWRVNNVAVGGSCAAVATTGGSTSGSGAVSLPVRLSATDYVELWTHQTTGAAVNLAPALFAPTMTLIYAGQ